MKTFIASYTCRSPKLPNLAFVLFILYAIFFTLKHCHLMVQTPSLTPITLHSGDHKACVQQTVY